MFIIITYPDIINVTHTIISINIPMVGLLNHYSLQPIYKQTKIYISSSNFQKGYHLTLFSLNLLDKIMLQQKGSEPFFD